MKRAISRRIGTHIAGTVIALVTTVVVAQDPAMVDTKHYKVTFENEQVRVLKITYGPKEKSVMHEHPNGVAIFLRDGQIRFHLADGKFQDATVKAGAHGPRQRNWTAQAGYPENEPGSVPHLPPTRRPVVPDTANVPIAKGILNSNFRSGSRIPVGFPSVTGRGADESGSSHLYQRRLLSRWLSGVAG